MLITLFGCEVGRMKTVYVFGNPYLEDDNLALKVAKKLSNIVDFVPCKSPDDLLSVKEEELILLDVVRDIKEPIIIERIEQIKTRKIISLHDFDVGFFLTLMHNTGWAKKIKIIGLPQQGNPEEISEEVKEWL